MFWLVWLISGFFAYGLVKGFYLNRCKIYQMNYGFNHEITCGLFFISGPIGVVAVLMLVVSHDGCLRFCLRVPHDRRGKGCP